MKIEKLCFGFRIWGFDCGALRSGRLSRPLIATGRGKGKEIYVKPSCDKQWPLGQRRSDDGNTTFLTVSPDIGTNDKQERSSM